MIKITVNEEEKNYQGQEVTVQDVLDDLSGNTYIFIVFLNDTFVDRLQYLSQTLSNGDELTVFPLVTGA